MARKKSAEDLTRLAIKDSVYAVSRVKATPDVEAFDVREYKIRKIELDGDDDSNKYIVDINNVENPKEALPNKRIDLGRTKIGNLEIDELTKDESLAIHTFLYLTEERIANRKAALAKTQQEIDVLQNGYDRAKKREDEINSNF